jgi:hypothetical protein
MNRRLWPWHEQLSCSGCSRAANTAASVAVQGLKWQNLSIRAIQNCRREFCRDRPRDTLHRGILIYESILLAVPENSRDIGYWKIKNSFSSNRNIAFLSSRMTHRFESYFLSKNHNGGNYASNLSEAIRGGKIRKHGGYPPFEYSGDRKCSNVGRGNQGSDVQSHRPTAESFPPSRIVNKIKIL